MISSSTIAAVLLAGGQSRRMGRDKAALPWGPGHRPLWHVQLEKLEALAPSVCLISARAEQEVTFSGHTVIADTDPGGGPLAALAAVFANTSQPYLLPLAVDTPFITTGFLIRLLDTAGECGLVYQNAAFFEPFPALYPRALAPLVDECLAAGRDSLQQCISLAIERRLLDTAPLAAPDSALFKNLNHPEDLR